MKACYRLTIYKSYPGYNCTKPPNMMYIKLQDMANHTSHIFSFTPGDHYGVSGGCGLFRKKQYIPDNVQAAADITLTESVYTEMVQEGNGLENQFLLIDDGKEPSMENCH